MICLAGNGWGAVAALESLQKEFNRIEIYSTDINVSKLIRDCDVAINDLNCAESEYVVCAGYQKVVSEYELKKKKYINIHYSLLPKYRGLHSVVWGILNGEEDFGVTVHLMDKNIDNGPIIKQFSFSDNTKNAKEVMEYCNAIVLNNLGGVVKSYINGEIVETVQNFEEATWVPRRNLDDCLIDYNETVHEISLLFRALVRPYPLPMIEVEGKRFEVTDYELKKRTYKCTIGRVVNLDENGAWIKIKDGLLIVKRLEIDCKKFNPNDILKIGQRLK
ncbi:methionyl-tRNA formyltransferase [Ferrimonas sp. SCSIO 43195]|uniref:methionyl-tRNA formyltransferase n=1 Tax=Ferrimonas sp. SCSIO 43195 TaxID=2822844 RepID=UPI00207503CC|nr:formyltransferase family protein [Ferrimonas sp. SCSIO 43195]USD38666.1 hypothetical protein J8Z22_06050 [Ferrimonas sp. SCSIO 43195]